MRTILALVALLAALTIGASALAADLIQGRASVIDGDTIEIHGERIRLNGIDAPESRQTCEKDGKLYRCGQQAALALADKLGSRVVTCNPLGRDRYSRTIAQCFVSGEDVNRWMVREGLAVAYRKYSSAYIADEEAARAAKRGMWAGSFVLPWEYRRRR